MINVSVEWKGDDKRLVGRKPHLQRSSMILSRISPPSKAHMFAMILAQDQTVQFVTLIQGFSLSRAPSLVTKVRL
jgi:hypothetical protein